MKPEKYKEFLREQFRESEYPEHVEQTLKSICKIAQDEVDFSEEQWEEVFSELHSEVELGDAMWIQ